MTFIVTLVGLLIERFFDCSHLRYWHWFHVLQEAVQKRFSAKPAYVTLALTILPVVAATGILELILAGWLYGFIKLLFCLFIFLYCLGPQNLWADTFISINALVQGDAHFAADKLKSAFGMTDITYSQSLHKQLLSHIFIEAERRVFGVLFWYVLLGPMGAVLYRLVVLSMMDAGEIASGSSLTARKVCAVLDYIPVRILTFLFALGGHFVQVLSVLRKRLLEGLGSSDALLLEGGVAALSQDQSNQIAEDGSVERAAIGLLDRSLAISLIIIAVFSLLI